MFLPSPGTLLQAEMVAEGVTGVRRIPEGLWGRSGLGRIGAAPRGRL